MLRTLFVIALIMGMPALQAAAAPTLDGRTFAVELVAEGGAKAEGTGKDVISFIAGFATCEQAGSKYGYAKGACKVMKGKNKDEMVFRFTMTSAEHGELVFEGTIQGTAISGKRTWSKPDKRPIVHRFSGKQQ